tara:strand:- start:714 stop:1568 length:855 start_codon:yes stop_codon:yes gene_type:complete
MMNKINTTEDKEATRMLMELLEDEANVDIAEEIKYPPVAISCGTYQDVDFDGNYTEYPIPLGTYGNFSFVQAPPKSMKSFFCSLLVSAYQQNGNKFTGKLKGHRQGKKIIHFDTEQGRFHCQKVFRRTMVMNELQTDENYHTYSLRSMSYKSRIDFIEYILKDKFEGKNIGLVIIDGAADMVSDVNNIEQCSEITQKLMSWTVDYNCHITTIIHSNFGSDKPTGHLGSFLEKKAETQIKLEKNTQNKGWVTVECKRSRNRGFETFSFQINKNGLPEFVNNDYTF